MLISDHFLWYRHLVRYISSTCTISLQTKELPLTFILKSGTPMINSFSFLSSKKALFFFFIPGVYIHMVWNALIFSFYKYLNYVAFLVSIFCCCRCESTVYSVIIPAYNTHFSSRYLKDLFFTFGFWCFSFLVRKLNN